MKPRLRVIDQGLVSPLRSQALYHGIAEAMHADDSPVLTLVSPEHPYVCIGIHQDLEAEVDMDYCREAGLPVLRRHVGGGAVYLDRDQLFFHFIYPSHLAPRRVAELYAHFVRPVLSTYRALGIPARLRPINDIHVNDRKIGGTGAAQIGEATLFVGSFLLDFDTGTMARCLKVPSEKFRDKLRGTLEDYITTVRRELGEIPPRQTLVDAFLGAVGDDLSVHPHADGLRVPEAEAVAAWEQHLQDEEWTRQPQRRRFPEGVKITGGVHLGESAHKAAGGLIRARVLSRDGRIGEAEISGDFTCLPADGVARLARELAGVDLREGVDEAVAARMASLQLDMPGIQPGDIAQALRATLPASA